MTTHPESLAALLKAEAIEEFNEALRIIKHCAAQLTDDQVWWRPSDTMNSIANLQLHLAGNLRQWIVSGVGGAPDVRERQQEFDQRDTPGKEMLFQQLEATVADVTRTIADVSAAELSRVRTVQRNAVTGLRAIFHAAAHLRGHTQEIVHMTRCQLGDSYRFDFTPPGHPAQPCT